MNKEERLALKKAEYEGSVFKTNKYGDVEVVEYINSSFVKIRFINTNRVKEEHLSSVRSGYVRDDSIPSTCGFGYIDIEGASIGRNMTKEYQLWNNMINRCYNEKGLSRNPSYKDCHVSEEWRYLSNFRDWCHTQTGYDQDGWQLDKDILIKGNKIYSEDNCCFVPPEINTLILKADRSRGKYPVGVYHDTSRIHKRFSARVSKNGKHKRFGRYLTPEEAFVVYKREKEKHIKEVANKWRDKIDPRVYEALMNWEINIDD